MKRNFLTKAFVCLFTVVALCSCSKDDDEENDNGNSGNSVIQNNTLVAVVENGASFNETIDSVKAVIYSETGGEITLAQGAYVNDGFTINLPESVDARYLRNINSFVDYEENVPKDVTVSNSDAKFGYVSLYAYKYSDVGEFYQATEDEEWDNDEELIYADRDVYIIGSDTDYLDKYKYNVYLKKGWNIIYYKSTQNNNSREIECTTQVPAGAKWYFYDYSSRQSSVSGSLLKPKPLSAKRTFGLK
jgi:hypothetical protein